MTLQHVTARYITALTLPVTLEHVTNLAMSLYPISLDASFCSFTRILHRMKVSRSSRGQDNNERIGAAGERKDLQDLVVQDKKSRSSEEVRVLCDLLGIWYLATLNTSVARGDFTSRSRADVLRSYCTALHT